MTGQPTTQPAELPPLIEAGYQLIPLHNFAYEDEHKGKRRKRGKSPAHGNWTKRVYRSADQIIHMEAGDNVGVRLTRADLVLDVDPRHFPDGEHLYSPESPFVELVLWTGIDPDLYPTVKTGSGGLHIYMKKPEDVSVRDSLNDEYPGVEFKSFGRQVVAPGSIHPDTKELYTWSSDPEDLWLGVPLAPEELLDLARRPKGAAPTGGGEHDQEELAQMLDALEPEDFRDHDQWRELMMACHHATAGDGRQEFIDWCTRDPEYSDHGTIIGIRWDSLHADNDGARVTYRTLHMLLRKAGPDGEAAIPRTPAADDFDDDLDEEDVQTPSKPEGFEPPIVVWKIEDGAIGKAVDAAVGALASSGERVFVRGEMLVTPTTAESAGLYDPEADPEMTIVRPPEAIVLPRVRPGHLEEIMNRVVRWRTVKPKTAAELRAEGEGAKPNKVVKCLPPVPVMRALQDRPKLEGVRRLGAVSSTPLVTPSGRIVEGEGYHPELQLLVDYGGRSFRPVPESPTEDDVRAALAACMAPMDGYRFADGASRTVALSGVLTALSRPLLPSAPIHGVSAERAGSGKTKLAQVWSVPPSGTTAAVMAPPERSEEFTKRIETALLEGDRSLLIDNCTRELGGVTLDALMTSPSMKCRILGQSEQPEVPTNIFVSATGNHFQLRGDTVRRGVVATILSDEEPWNQRFDFDPVNKALQTREEMVWGALVIMRAYHVAGRPGAGSHGSFEAWDRTCGSAAWWALGSKAGDRATDTIAGQVEGDPERDDRLAVAEAWAEVFGDRPATLRDAVAMTEDPDAEADDREAAERLLGLLRSASGVRTNDTRTMGHALRRVAGTRVEDGGVFRQVGKGMHGKRYAVVA